MEKDLPALVRSAGMTVMVGGLASVQACDAIDRAGADTLGRDIEHGVKRIDELLSSN